MLDTDTDTKRRIDTARDILVGKVPDPKSQVEQITIALIYKFMNDMDAESEELGGNRKFFAGGIGRSGWAQNAALRPGWSRDPAPLCRGHHLDLEMREAQSEALQDCEGTLLLSAASAWRQGIKPVPGYNWYLGRSA
jgi:hypothetical protein